MDTIQKVNSFSLQLHNLNMRQPHETRMYLNGFLEQKVISGTLLYDLLYIHNQCLQKEINKKCKDL